MEGFPSGQREQTVNLSSMTSVVRIHHLPPKEPILIRVSVLFWCQVEWIRKPALRNVPVARFNRRGFAAAKRIHHRTGRQACSSAVIGLHQTLKLDTRPNRRGIAAAKRIHHRTGRHACGSVVRGLHRTLKLGTRLIQRKERSFDDEINLHRPFVTIYCRLRRYPVGGAQCAPRQRKIIRFVGEHSDSLRAAYGGCSLDAHCGGCVRPYGIDCTDRKIFP